MPPSRESGIFDDAMSMITFTILSDKLISKANFTCFVQRIIGIMYAKIVKIRLKLLKLFRVSCALFPGDGL